MTYGSNCELQPPRGSPRRRAASRGTLRRGHSAGGGSGPGPPAREDARAAAPAPAFGLPTPAFGATAAAASPIVTSFEVPDSSEVAKSVPRTLEPVICERLSRSLGSPFT